MKKSLIVGIVATALLVASVAAASEQFGKQNSQNQNPGYGYQPGHRGYGYYKSH